MEVKIKEINYQRVKVNIICLILQTILSISMLIASILTSIDYYALEPVLIIWIFTIIFIYGNVWLMVMLIFDLSNKLNNTNELKVLFSGIGSIISIFTLLVWIISIREIYYERKYSINLLDETEQKNEKSLSKGE